MSLSLRSRIQLVHKSYFQTIATSLNQKRGLNRFLKWNLHKNPHNWYRKKRLRQNNVWIKRGTLRCSWQSFSASIRSTRSASRNGCWKIPNVQFAERTLRSMKSIRNLRRKKVWKKRWSKSLSFQLFGEFPVLLFSTWALEIQGIFDGWMINSSTFIVWIVWVFYLKLLIRKSFDRASSNN